MFKPQFAPLVEAGRKLQTVRPTPKRMPKPGDKISLRAWTGKPYRSKQRVLMDTTITRVASFRMDYDDRNGMAWWEFEVDGTPMDSVEAVQFAKSDGFASVPEMAEWFRSTHGLPFEGIVIHWHNAELMHPPTQDPETL